MGSRVAGLHRREGHFRGMAAVDARNFRALGDQYSKSLRRRQGPQFLEMLTNLKVVAPGRATALEVWQ